MAAESPGATSSTQDTSGSPNATVLLIGASRGLGYAIAEEYIGRGSRVIATVRGAATDQVRELASRAEGRLEIERLDITDVDGIEALHERLSNRRFDLLFVVAGTTSDPDTTSADVTTDEFDRLMVTNALSPMRLVQMLGDLVEPDGTIAVMSSGQGSIANNENGGFEIYRATKSALNQLMRSFDARRDDDRTLLLTAPGWVKTDLGGPGARLEIRESIPKLVSVVDARRGQGSLQFVDYEGRTVDW